MIIKKISIVIIVMALILSGLSLVSVGNDSTTDIANEGGTTPRPMAGSSPRTVLVEMLTADWCAPCPAQTHTLERLESEYGTDQVVFIEYHGGGDEFELPFIDPIFSGYGANGFPTTIFDGGGPYTDGHLRMGGSLVKYGPWADDKADIEEELATGAPLTIALDGYIDGFNGQINVTLDFMDTPTENNLELNAVIMESNLHHIEGAQEAYCHHRTYNNIARDMLTPISLPAGVGAGTHLEYTFNFTLDPSWYPRMYPNRISTAVFVQTTNSYDYNDGSNRHNFPVMQAAYHDFTPDDKVLVVKADSTDLIDNDIDYIIEELVKVNVQQHVWDTLEPTDSETLNAMTMPTASDMSHYNAVIWYCGKDTSTLNATDRANIAAYFEDGGNVYLEGANIVEDARANGWESWLETYFYVGWTSSSTGASNISGVSGDVIGDGFSLLNVSASSSLDGISLTNPTDGAISFNYNTGQAACVRGDNVSSAKGRSYFSTSNYFLNTDTIDADITDETIMTRIMDWLIEPVPTHDVSVICDDDVLPVYDYGSQHTFNCTVYNTGTSDESNLEVKFTLNGVTQDTQYIVSLPMDPPQVLNFSWTAPIAGFYDLAFEVSTVSGEIWTSNNIWTKNIEVIYHPENDINPGGFDLVVPMGGTDSATLNIGNSGPGILDWVIGSLMPLKPWFSVTPATGTTSPYSQNTTTLNIDTTGLLDGSYQQWLSIVTNDPNETVVWVPVNLTVTLSNLGYILLNETLYGSESTATVTVKDLGLNTDSGTVQTVSVNVSSNTEPGGEVITLTETGPDTSIFEGTLTFSVTNSAGILQVSDGDTITATYNDADNGTGPAIVTATASVDGIVSQTSSFTVEWSGMSVSSIISEDFEDALTAEWSTYSSNATNGRNQRDTYAAAAGTYSWRMDVITSGSLNLNELVVQFDASVYSNLNLSFNWRQYNDEKHAMPVNFTGHGNYDGVAVSTDGNNWTRIWEYSTGGVNWETVGPTSIDSLISIAGNVYVKFQQYDNLGIISDGFLWDEIYINGTIIVASSNVLNWTLSPDDGAGADDVVQYNIYRADNAAGPWDAGALIDTVSSGTNTYIDSGRGEPDGINWWYVVRAVDQPGNEDPNTNAVNESVIIQSSYNINMTDYSTGEWSFISFPHSTSGNIETILDDSVLGDGGTTWDVAKWYNPQDTVDPWKTYRAGASTNDLATIDNTMGVWVHLTGNGGDQNLTLSQKGAYSTSVNINLYTGWNLVSYPSATARLASTTLPGAADMVAYYNSGAAYLVTEALPTAVTFSEGNAYWVHVTSDTFWFVTP